MPAPLLVGLVLVIALLVAIPTRRLYLAGWRGWPLLGYFGFVVGLGLLVAELRGPARFLVPILVIAYLAPFVTARDGVARLLGREGTPPRSVKDVTPPEGREGDPGRDHGPGREGDSGRDHGPGREGDSGRDGGSAPGAGPGA